MLSESRDRVRLFEVVLAIALSALSACGSPTEPQHAEGDIAGLWTGSAIDSSGAGQMTWQIVQTGASFSGAITMTDTASNVRGRGSVAGTVDGSSLHFSISIPVGGFDSPFASCSTDVSGDATSSASLITGAYSGLNSCSGAVTSGQISLSRSS
jgi:hypothetical protein